MPKRKTEEGAEDVTRAKVKSRSKKSVPVKNVKDEDQEPATPSKGRSKKAQPAAPTEPYVDQLGWHIHPPSLIYRKFGEPKPSKKIAAFDLDGTLAVTKRAASTFGPVDENDWKFFNKNVPTVLQEFINDGYAIVIFSNQNGIKSALDGKMATKVKNRTKNILSEVNLPCWVFLATDKDQYRKPELGMWNFFLQHATDGVLPDLKRSFFVGDAAGRVGDFAATDKEFAANAKIRFKTPEELFGEGPKRDFVAPTAEGGGAVENNNPELSGAFFKLADKYSGDRFKGSAFKKVADILAGWPAKIKAGKDLKDVKGVGKASMAKIDEFLTTGTLADLEEEGGAGGGAGGTSSKKGDVALKFI